MQTAKIIFGSNNKPFSVIIKIFTLSNWCHCGIIDGDYVIDSTLATGVRRITLEEWKTHYSKYEIVEMPIKNLNTSLKWARAEVGKKYDMLGILSLAVRKNYEERDKWFCSELVAEYLGIQYKVWRLSPQFLKQLSNVLKGWIS
jgi:hypothetical protein